MMFSHSIPVLIKEAFESENTYSSALAPSKANEGKSFSKKVKLFAAICHATTFSLYLAVLIIKLIVLPFIALILIKKEEQSLNYSNTTPCI